VTEVRLSTRRELELMQQLQQLADRRAQQEQVLSAALASELGDAEKEFEETSRRLCQEHAEKRRDLEAKYAEAKRTALAAFDSDMREAEFERSDALKAAEHRRDAIVVGAEHHAKEAEWQALSLYDAQKNKPFELVEAAALRITARRRQTDGLERDAHTLLAMRGLSKLAESFDWRAALAELEDGDEEAESTPPPQKPATAEERHNATLAELHDAVIRLQDLKIPSLFNEGGRRWAWVAAAIILGTLLGGLVGFLSPMGWVIGLAAGFALGLILAVLVLTVIVPRGRRASLLQYAVIRRMLEQARQLEADATAESRAASDRMTQEIIRRRDHELASSKARRDKAVNDAQAVFAAESAKLEPRFAERKGAVTAERDRLLAGAEENYPPLLKKADEERSRGDEENARRFEQRRQEANAKHDAAWQAMADEWFSGFRAISGELEGMQERCQRLFANWDEDFAAWQRPTEPPEAIRFGECPLPLQLVKHGLPEDKRLDPGIRRLVLPASMAFQEQPRVVVSADGPGRKAAVEVLQLLMLRFLTSMPAGKLRFTILDPVGLGENFAAFMHLADYDEQLIGSRIWTDPKQIDERLSLVTEHMEKVLQKYLRNEFATIHEYNQTAGEVSEPYHVVVAANFPAGFSDAAARKLVSISQSGPRCGVFTLLSIDTQLRLPHEFKLQDLLSDAVHLQWAQERLVWNYPLFEKLPLEMDRLPDSERMIDVLRLAGQQSREASKVEVPFSLVAPKADEVWAGNSARELVVPIGRAGAKELQSVRLGIGTSQHALISGKTGSGKSTLLHAIITNAALHYSPDQVELYLIDFKKGVEFKAYANGRLPHARVIAIESEREFGVSVLERLDVELRRRGELFRTHGVQDLAGFRHAAPDIPMPRTLLIIDEFQELFVADDKLAQDAALLLDRLVRQGRAFGIHVMLGSQTLAGAYSLARSTLGQMAVRIALECSEADAHLILSDENTAARLLSRPGEAIYNDQNGLVEGNHPFQVVWLPDPQRQQYLQSLREQPVLRLPTTDPTIVFEGNVPADPRDNPELVAAIEHPERTTHQEPKIWLGSAVRIEPATHLMLRRQGGHNLAIIGQDERMAAGMLANAVVALAAQHGEAGAKFTVLDGTRPDSAVLGLWPQVAAAVGDTVVDVAPPRGAAHAITALADEVARRSQSPEERYGSIYLVIYDLAQFRDLRVTEDDFSFSFSSSNGKSPSPDKRFREILKEGPLVGVHVLLWCESYNSMTRSIDRVTMREIEYRVAMQMSAGDSTSLIDSPAATLLGEHRALLYRDDLGTQTKFRPYGRPTEEWLAWAARQLQRGVATKI
jgi:DNA segregation ATPase FtsK/SpoIIIE, S-DNA-T family